MADNKRWLARIRHQLDSSYSAAADYWNTLSPTWRAVVLHAASVHDAEILHPRLAQYSWNELYAQVGCRGMAQLRIGILRARNMFNAFGPLGRNEFTRRTAHRAAPSRPSVTPGQELVIAPETLRQLERLLAQRERLKDRSGWDREPAR